jgi:hypothetical protein
VEEVEEVKEVKEVSEVKKVKKKEIPDPLTTQSTIQPINPFTKTLFPCFHLPLLSLLPLPRSG